MAYESSAESNLDEWIDSIERSDGFNEILERIASSMVKDDRGPTYEDLVRRLLEPEDGIGLVMSVSRHGQLPARPILDAFNERVTSLAVQAAEPANEQIRGQLDAILGNIELQFKGTYTPPGDAVDTSPATPADPARLQSIKARAVGGGALYLLVFAYLSDAMNTENKAHLHALAFCITITLLLANEATKP